MLRATFRCLILFAAVLCSGIPAFAIGPNPAWKPRQLVAANVNLSRHVGADNILAFDHFGNPGIAYALASPDTWLMYARNVPGIGWQSSIADGGNRGAYPSLLYDRRELPVIGYSSSNLKRQVVVNHNGTSWGAQYLGNYDDDTFNTGGYNSLAIDSTGKLASAYQHALSGSFLYMKDTDGDGSFADETAQPIPGGQGYYATLAFDPLDRPMIAHFDANTSDLKFSVLDTGMGWLTTTVDSVGLTGSHLSLAIDPDNGYPAISYFDDTNDDLRYAAWDGASWIKTTIDSAGAVGLYTSLAFDPSDGNPAISYYDQTNGDLKLAWFDGTNWQKQIVDGVGNVGVTTSIAFNPYGDGFPAIAYGDSLNNLYYIVDPPASVPEPSSVVLLALSGVFALIPARNRSTPAETV